MNYNTLTSQIRALLRINNTSFDAWIPQFIRQAEERICREVTSLEMSKDDEWTLGANEFVFNKPPQWKRPLSCHYVYNDIYISLKWRSFDFIKEYSPSSVNPVGTQYPLFWGDEGPTRVIFKPTPTAQITLKVNYYARPDSIVDTKEGTVLSTLAPNALLYATLLEAVPFVNDGGKVELWDKYYQSSIMSLKNVDILNKVARPSNRDAE